ncbi:exopolysaccharide Pel transporter PelG [Hydrogenimonas sp. SS33]|uniref:exopolysaccharide Pel transporter PelG n=1 Tax=Hydrogenimonas leucolamina TaxID=2954236 RepID=UPI00336C0471
MAGIGFELRKVLKEDSILSLGKVYGYAALLSSGPWVISIIAIIVVGFINVATMGRMNDTVQFQIVVTYAIALASSLIITGFVQLPFTRYIADLIFAHQEEKVLPSYFGTIFMAWLAGIPFVVPAVIYVFPDEDIVFKLNVVSIFLVLCGVWISNILATSLKYYKGVLWAYVVSYGLIVLLSYMAGGNVDHLLTIFFLGNALLFVWLFILIVKHYKGNKFLDFGFFLNKKFYWTLGIAGLFYNLGSWVDKFIFWYYPSTGYPVIGKLHASILYDLPIFLAYLSIVPGMAIFFFRLEADFAQKYELYYDVVRNDGTLEVIEHYRDEMIRTIRHAIREIIIIQGIIDIILFMFAPQIFSFLHIPQLYIGLFYILTVGAMLQLGFMSVLAILYYLDRRREAMWLSILFFVLNALFTFVSIKLGPPFYGYGYALSLLISFAWSLKVVRDEMEDLDYETFMLR